ncbi:hypothetical protein TNCV_493991 [Trichonephila clavipes]|nr:hypothetical protein TNCV_493991 [Trichonephila clavipes]
MPSIEEYYPYGLASILSGLESSRACVGCAWATNCSPSNPPTCLPELGRMKRHLSSCGQDFKKLNIVRHSGAFLKIIAKSQALECLMATRVGPPSEGRETTQPRTLIGQIK